MEKLLDTIKLNVDNTQIEIILDVMFRAERKDTSPLTETVKELHFHPYYEFFFVGSEDLKIVTEDGTSYFKNSVVIIPPKLKHYSKSKKGTYRFFVNITEQKAHNNFVFHFFDFISEKKIHYTAKNECLMFYLCELEKVLTRKSTADKLKTEPMLNVIFLSTAELFNTESKLQNEHQSSNFSKYVFKIEQILANAFTEKINLSYISEKLFLSERQASRIINKAYNTSLSELIKDKKLSAAAILLKTTDKPIATIISELNFQTESYFFVLFKKKYGVSPRLYRKQAMNIYKED
jgi:AraC-like DNA-binding protein